MLYLLYRIGVFLSLVLPLRILYRVADFSGSLYYLLAKKDRRILANNIKVVLNQSGDAHRISQTSQAVFMNFARYLVEFFRTARIDLKYIEKHITIVGRENLDQALRLGKGVLLVGAHLGNWELGAMVLSILGYKINIVAWTHKNRLINDFFLKQRQSKGVKIIPLGAGIRKVFSVLKNNELVGLLGDIDYLNPETGITVKLFGQDTIIPKGPAEFSLRTGAPIVPTFVIREKGNTFRYVLEKPIVPAAKEVREYALTRLTQDLAKTIESYIAMYPGQWFMLTPRWKEQDS